MGDLTAQDMDVLRYAVRLRIQHGLERQDVDDVVQEAALSAWLTALPESEPHRARFLMRIGQRRAIDEVRRQSAGVETTSDEEEEEHVRTRAAVEDMSGDAYVDLTRALATLEPMDASVVLLVAAGHEASEIAGSLGTSARMVWNRSARGRRRLREAMLGEVVQEPRRSPSPRQLEVLRLIGDGATNAEVAAALSMSEKTVEKHRGAIIKAAGTSRLALVVRWAIREGYVEA